MEQAAHELMDASDYLPECVQSFTINGDVAFMEQYFEEALDVGRREKAIEKMAKSQKAGAAREQLVEALENSVKLMDREYYAMRLVIEAKGYTDYPEVLKNVVLSEEDKALSPEEKIRHATEMVLDNVYYDQKNKIRRDMKESLGEVYDLMYGVESSALTVLKKDIGAVHVLLLMQIVSICIMLRISSLFGIKPILKAVDKIKEDSPIPETGANEYVYLAKAYNKMYAKNKTNLAQLNFLRERTCLFIGCSLTDPNLRRLLDVATRNNEKPRHYAFLRRNHHFSTKGIDIDALNAYKSIDMNLREKYYSTMGLNIIWIEKYDEIPQILKSFLT